MDTPHGLTHGMKRLELDGAELFFDRETGRNLLFRGEETKHCRQKAPRVIQMALTNACNKTCGFCYRPLEAKSRWGFDEVVEFGKFISNWGVLEVALGGGEPTVFPKFPQLLRTLWDQTELAINFTTNGTRLTSELLQTIAGGYGQIQVSVYDDEDTDAVVAKLVEHDVRFGLNYLVTPKRLETLDADLIRWWHQGVKDVLLLSYKGDEAIHLTPEQLQDLDQRIHACHRFFRGRMQLKVDVCWSSRLKESPQLFYDDDCRAGALFMSVTSDKKVLSCSFAEGGIPFERFEELPEIWRTLKEQKLAAQTPGCARLPKFGLSETQPTPTTGYPEAM